METKSSLHQQQRSNDLRKSVMQKNYFDRSIHSGTFAQSVDDERELRKAKRRLHQQVNISKDKDGLVEASEILENRNKARK